jgi:hypothetical protein
MKDDDDGKGKHEKGMGRRSEMPELRYGVLGSSSKV